MSSERQSSFEFATFFGAIPLIRVILSSIGVTAVLVGIGYIVAYSRQHLLGIDITRAATTADYAALGARFFVDVMVVSYEHFVPNLALLGGILGGMFAIVMIARRVIILPPLKYRSFLMLVVLLLLMCKLGYYDIPFVLHRDVLFARTDYSENFDVTRPLNGRAKALWTYFASRHDIHGHKEVVQAAEKNLEAEFLEDVALTWLLTYAALIALRRTPRWNPPSPVDAEGPRPMRGALLPLLTSITLVMSIVSVPFTYGKAMWDAQLPYVIVTVRTSSPPTAPPDSGRRRTLGGLLLASDEKTILLYSTTEYMIAEYSRAEVEVIRFPSAKDLIGEHIAFTNRAPGT